MPKIPKAGREVTPRPKPVVGQTLYSLNVGNAARNRPQALTTVVVTSVGRKFFTTQVEGRKYSETKYRLDNWSEVTHYIPDTHLYLCEQDWIDEKERGALMSFCEEAFGTFS